MNGLGRRAIAVLFAAGTVLGLLGGVAVARVGGDATSSETASGDERGVLGLVQTQETTPPAPGDGPRRLCPNRDGNPAPPGTSPSAAPSDTSL